MLTSRLLRRGLPASALIFLLGWFAYISPAHRRLAVIPGSFAVMLNVCSAYLYSCCSFNALGQGANRHPLAALGFCRIDMSVSSSQICMWMVGRC